MTRNLWLRSFFETLVVSWQVGCLSHVHIRHMDYAHEKRVLVCSGRFCTCSTLASAFLVTVGCLYEHDHEHSLQSRRCKGSQILLFESFK